MGSIKESKGQPKCALVWRTGLSSAPPDSVRCTRGLQAELFTFRNFHRRSTIIHRTVRCTTGLCPVPQGRATLNSPASGIRSAQIHRTVRCTTGLCPVPQGRATLNSPASGIRSAKIHRTVRCNTGLSGEPAEQRLLRAQRSTATH
jgi:hypothetical protein